MRRRLLFACLAVGALVASSACGTTGVTSGPDLHPDATAAPVPADQLAAVDAGGFKSIFVGLEGRPIVVNVWASWCAPCRVEAPLLQKAFARYGGAVAFVGVDANDARDDAQAFLAEFDIRYPNLFDESGEVRDLLQTRGLPTTFIFDRDGHLVTTVLGGISEQQLAAQLAALTSR
ncbi:MAG: TlpA disulfide reductase family protein [Acidimicrobiales bacterium]